MSRQEIDFFFVASRKCQHKNRFSGELLMFLVKKNAQQKPQEIAFAHSLFAPF